MDLIIVRHAAPQVAPDVDPRHWRLSTAGQTAAADLAGQLPLSGRWVASTETKAHQTLLLAGAGDVVVHQDSCFDEVHRVEPFDDNWRRRRLAWVEGELDEQHVDWETPVEAARRFDRAVVRHAGQGLPLVVGSHGMVIAAWLVHVGRLEPGMAGAFWQNLALPAIVRPVEADSVRK